MLIKIDTTANRFGLADVSDAHGDYRRYYAADAPDLMIIVTRDSLALADCIGRVVDGSVGWHEGRYGFVRPGNEDKRHSKVTIHGIAPKGLPVTTLAQLLIDSPKE